VPGVALYELDDVMAASSPCGKLCTGTGGAVPGGGGGTIDLPGSVRSGIRAADGGVWSISGVLP